MQTPDTPEFFEGPLATYWFDKDGIFYAKIKNVPRTPKKTKETFSFLRQLLNNKKVCYIVDATYLHTQDKATRDYIAKQLPEMFKAIALISKTPLGKMVGNIFFRLNSVTYPHENVC